MASVSDLMRGIVAYGLDAAHNDGLEEAASLAERRECYAEAALTRLRKRNPSIHLPKWDDAPQLLLAAPATD